MFNLWSLNLSLSLVLHLAHDTAHGIPGYIYITGPCKGNLGPSTFRKIRAPCLSPPPMSENQAGGAIRWISKEHWLFKISLTSKGPLQAQRTPLRQFFFSSFPDDFLLFPIFFFYLFFSFFIFFSLSFLERKGRALRAPLKSRGLIGLYTALYAYIYIYWKVWLIFNFISKPGKFW